MKKEDVFRLVDDGFKIKWDDRNTECKIGVRFSILRNEKERKWDYFDMYVDLSDKNEYIEEVIEERNKIRKELEDDFNLCSIIAYKENYRAKDIISFLKACAELKLDMGREIAFIKKEKLKNYVEFLERGITSDKESIKQYKKNTERYRELVSDIAKIKEELSWLKSL